MAGAGDTASPPEPRRPDDRIPDDLTFRCAAAPGLDEDDLFVALVCGSPAPGRWGDGRAWPVAACEGAWDADEERRRRHERMLDTWRVIPVDTLPE